MTTRPRSRSASTPVLRLGCVGLLALASCTDKYLARRDALTIVTGDAVARNAAVHTIDPWPAAARRTDDIVSGERLQRAVERYRNPAPAAGAGAFGAGEGAAPVAPPPPSLR